MKRAIALVLYAAALSGCATGVSRPLGKCSDTATRRPVAPSRWPGGMAQLKSGQGPGLITAPAEEAPPTAAPQAVRASAATRPPTQLAPLPAPASALERLPQSIEINPMRPVDGANQGAALPLGLEGACNG